MKKIHYGIFVCAACTLAMICVVGFSVSSFPIFLPYIIDNGGLTKTQGSMLLSLRGLSSMVTILLLVEYYLKKLDMRLGIFIATTMTALAFCIYSTATNYWAYCFGAILSGAAYSFGGMIPVAILINRWFDTNGATALCICSAGSGVATIIMPLVITNLVKMFSLNTTFLVVAIFVGISALIIVAVLRNDPKEKNLAPFRKETTELCVAPTPEQDSEEKRYVILGITMAIFLINAALQTNFLHINVLYITEGADEKILSVLISAGGIVLTLSKCLFGYLTDHYGVYKTGNIYLLLALAGCIFHCMAATDNIILMALAIELTYAGSTLCTVAIAAYAKDVSAVKTYEKNVKIFQLAGTVGAFAFTPIPGIIADITGSYIQAYILLVILIVLAICSVQFCYICRKGNSKRNYE